MHNVIFEQPHRDEPALDNNNNIIDFPNNNNSISFKFKQKRTEQTESDSTKDIEIMVPLKYLINFWRTLEMPLINSEINLMLTWLESCILVGGTVTSQVPTFRITDTKLYHNQDNSR